MFTRLMLVSSVAVLLSACGGGLGSPDLELDVGGDTTLERLNGVWNLVTAIKFRSGYGAVDLQAEARVREVSGGFLTGSVQTFKVPSGMLTGSPGKLTIPLKTVALFPRGRTVTLELDVMCVNWNGVDERGVEIATTRPSFYQQ